MYAKGQLRYPKGTNRSELAYAHLKAEDRRAIQWAIAKGYSIPDRPSGCLWAIGITCGLFAAVVPGLLLILFLVVKQRDYDREIRQLHNKWVDAGRPDPQEPGP
jgi:hypothetical protein